MRGVGRPTPPLYGTALLASPFDLDGNLLDVFLYELHRPRNSDYDFLKDVHHITLRSYVERIWGWDDKVQDEFFRKDFESGQIQIIRAFNKTVGYLQLNEEEGVVNIVNILILPEFQGRKLGTEIIKDLIDKSVVAKQILRLGVFKINTRAKKLYDSLGFVTKGESETHFLMEIT